MNELTYRCPHCRKNFRVGEDSDAYLVPCPHCGFELDLTELDLIELEPKPKVRPGKKHTRKGPDPDSTGEDIIDRLRRAIKTVADGLGQIVDGALNIFGLDEEDLEPEQKLCLCEIALLAKMAKVDGRVNKDEIHFVKALFDNWQLDVESRKLLQKFFTEQKKSVSDAKEWAECVLQAAIELNPDDKDGGIDIRLQVYRHLFEMAFVDGELDDKEIALLRALPDPLGFKPEVFDLVFDEFSGSLRKSKKEKLLFCEIALLAKMAKVDGRVNKDEIDFVKALFDDWQLDVESRKVLQKFFTEQKKDVSDAAEWAKGILLAAIELNPDDKDYGIDIRLQVYRHLFVMAFVDGELDDAELALLRTLPEPLGFKPEVFDLLVAEFSESSEHENDPDLASAYAMLGVSPDASNAEVKKAWRRNLMVFHPDKILSKNLDPEWIELANQKIAEINKAYETIKLARDE